jgi:hypothetical protein
MTFRLRGGMPKDGDGTIASTKEVTEIWECLMFTTIAVLASR